MSTLIQLLPPLLIAMLAAVATYAVAPLARRAVRDVLDGVSKRWNRGSGFLIDRVFLLVALAGVIGFTAQSVHNYDAFRSYPDFRYFDNVLFNILHKGEISIYFYRFDPIMLALAPLYSVWGDPRVLLVLQSVGLSIAAFPLYWSARVLIGRLLALGVVLAYLVHPSVQSLNYPVFTEIKLAVPLLSFATFFLLRQRYLPFLACLGVSLLLKQEVAFTAVGFAAFIFLIQRKRLLGFALAAGGLGLAIVFLQILYPALTGSPYPHFGSRYSYLGNSMGEIALALIQRPQVALQEVLTPQKIEFVLSLLTPVVWLPLIGIEIGIIALPAWAYTLLSQIPMQFDPTQYYQAPLIPFIFFGTIVGLERLLHWKGAVPEWSRWQLALLVLVLVGAEMYFPSTWTRILNPSAFVLDAHDALGHKLLTLVPRGASVVATTEFFMPFHATHQYYLLDFSPHEDYSERGDSALEIKGDLYLFGDSTRTYYKLHRNAWERWRASGYFETIAEEDGYFVLKRKTLAVQRTTLENGLVLIGSPESGRFQVDNKWALLGYADKPTPFLKSSGVTFENELTLLGYALLPSDSTQGGNTVRAIVEWRADQDIRNQYTVIAHLVDARGHVWAQDDREPVYGLVPTPRWKAGDIIRDQYTFVLPVEMPPGNYRVTLSVWDQQAGKSLPMRDAAQRQQGLELALGSIAVAKNTTSIPGSYLPIERPLSIDLREIRLLGSTSLPETVGAGEELPVGLYWRAREKPRGDYTVSIQLRDPSGRVGLEQSDKPAAGAYPTLLWQVGEILLDWHDLTLPANLPPGDYTLTVVLQNVTDQTVVGEAKIAVIRVVKK